MRELASILIAVVLTLLTVNYVVLAFTEPSQPPPSGNVAAPLNVGPGRQVKSGDLTVGNLSATSITLGGDTRFIWPFPGGGGGGGIVGPACNWQGIRCECVEDITGAGEGFLILATSCRNSLLSDVRIVDFEIGGEKAGFFSSKDEDKACPVVKPAGCDIYLPPRRTEG